MDQFRQKQIEEVLNSYNKNYTVIPKDDTYQDLFRSIVYISKTFHNNGFITGDFCKDNIKTIFKGSREILLLAINIILQCYDYSIFNLSIELEFNKIIHQNLSISSTELNELILTKNLVYYIQKNDSNTIYTLISYFCSFSLRNELFPTINWLDEVN